MFKQTNSLSITKRVVSGVMGAALLLTNSLGLFAATPVAHADTSLTATPRVTFTFDDGLQSASTLAAPTLKKYGFTGTDYVITHCVDMTTVPNTCLADTGVPYMTWAQVQALQADGWNIGSHTQDHIYLASNGGGEQSYIPTLAQIKQQLDGSKADLAAKGITALDFAAPYGDYNNDVLAVAAKDYLTFRGFADIGYNTWPYNDRLVVNQQIQEGKQATGGAPTVTFAMAKSYIDTAIANNQWLTLTFHDIRAIAPTSSDDYATSNSLLDQIAAYVKTQVDAGKVSVVSPHDAVVTSSTNLLANGGFDSAISTDYQNRETNSTVWTTDDTTGTLVHNDANGNGSLIPGDANSVTNSLYISANGGDAHIWSPKVTVSSANTYIVKGFFNITKFTPSTATPQPEVAYYVDEYDATGKIVASQYQSAVRYDPTNPTNGIRVKNANFAYKPSSAAVVAARIYVSVQANGGITGYMDNLQMIGQAAAATKPGDVNGDGAINAVDLSTLSSHWNTATGATRAQGDLNGDGAINAVDLSILSTNWGK
jgi:peptidoglycan/xylan/chitin deacetylase (PgdA/CDA1 family)